MLEDLLYFYKNGELFCARDFASLMNIPRCAACDELIFSEEYTGAEDSFWHVKHFCCWVCDLPLAGHKYIPVEGKPHCLACWQTHHGKVCSTCKQPIDAQGKRVSLGSNHWHASSECFRCSVCKISLLGGKMSLRDGALVCSSSCSQKVRETQQSLRQRQKCSELGQSSVETGNVAYWRQSPAAGYTGHPEASLKASEAGVAGTINAPFDRGHSAGLREQSIMERLVREMKHQQNQQSVYDHEDRGKKYCVNQKLHARNYSNPDLSLIPRHAPHHQRQKSYDLLHSVVPSEQDEKITSYSTFV